MADSGSSVPAPGSDEGTSIVGEAGSPHVWSEWIPGSFGSRYRYCLDDFCDAGEIR